MLIPFVQNAKESNNLCYAVGEVLEAKKLDESIEYKLRKAEAVWD